MVVKLIVPQIVSSYISLEDEIQCCFKQGIITCREIMEIATSVFLVLFGQTKRPSMRFRVVIQFIRRSMIKRKLRIVRKGALRPIKERSSRRRRRVLVWRLLLARLRHGKDELPLGTNGWLEKCKLFFSDHTFVGRGNLTIILSAIYAIFLVTVGVVIGVADLIVPETNVGEVS